MQDLTRHGPSTVDKPSGASQLVLSGELTEGVSDLSEAMTAPGGVPALREVNQDRSHPEAPMVEEQNQPGQGNYRHLVPGAPGGHTDRGWDTVSGGARGVHRDFPLRPHAEAADAQARREQEQQQQLPARATPVTKVDSRRT